MRLDRRRRGRWTDVYRVFEALDELVTIAEEARGLPMTTSCVVPRGDVLELLDDIREAIPGELDDAQDVLDHRDGGVGVQAQRRLHPGRPAGEGVRAREVQLDHRRPGVGGHQRGPREVRREVVALPHDAHQQQLLVTDGGNGAR